MGCYSYNHAHDPYYQPYIIGYPLDSMSLANLKSYTKEEISYRDGGQTLRQLAKQEEAAKTDEERAEIAKKRELYKNELWIILHGLVIDVSKFLNRHPGGPDSFRTVAGGDATVDFEDIYHSQTARQQLREMIVGKLDTYDGDIEAVFKVNGGDAGSQNFGIIIAVGAALAAAAYYAFF